MVSWFQADCQTTAIGARSVSLSGISAGLADIWAVANNPAGLGRYDHLSLATSLEQRFLMKELGYYAVAASLPADKGCFGIFTMYSGYQSFIDQKASIGYGRPFGDNVLAGLSLVYVYQKAGENTPVHQLSYDLGTMVVLSKKINLAFATFNPFQLYYKSKAYATLPSIFRIGLSYQYSQAFHIHSEIEKDLDLSPMVKIGMEYIIRELFFIRFGVKGFPVSYSFGAAFRQQGFLFEFASSYHQYLGFTPNLSLQFDFR